LFIKEDIKMIRDIVKDESILTQKSEHFIFGEDEYIIQDLLDTANEHKENCAGLASIQIGIPKRVILVRQGDRFVPFINPMIIQKSPKTYIATEGCLSLDGQRTVQRHASVKVVWRTPDGTRKVQMFNGYVAEILQHEIDHCNGIII
jgi:peptide deformylase